MQYRELIDEVKAAGQLRRDEEAERALRATLITLGECGAPVDRLAQTLPPEVSGYLQGGWAGGAPSGGPRPVAPRRQQTQGRTPGREHGERRREMNEAERRLASQGSHRLDTEDQGAQGGAGTARTDPERWTSHDRGERVASQRGPAGGGPLPSESGFRGDGRREEQIRNRDHYQRAIMEEEPGPMGSQPSHAPTRAVVSTDDFLGRVAEREGGVSQRTAEIHVRAVLTALDTAIDRALLREVCAGLPGLDPLWSGPTPQA